MVGGIDHVSSCRRVRHHRHRIGVGQHDGVLGVSPLGSQRDRGCLGDPHQHQLGRGDRGEHRWSHQHRDRRGGRDFVHHQDPVPHRRERRDLLGRGGGLVLLPPLHQGGFVHRGAVPERHGKPHRPRLGDGVRLSCSPRDDQGRAGRPGHRHQRGHLDGDCRHGGDDEPGIVDEPRVDGRTVLVVAAWAQLHRDRCGRSGVALGPGSGLRRGRPRSSPASEPRPPPQSLGQTLP